MLYFRQSACRNLLAVSRSRRNIGASEQRGLDMIRTFIGSVTAAALLAGVAAPASARPYWRGGGWGGYHHRGGGDTFGNILLGAVIGGGLLAVASSARKNGDHVLESRRGDDQRDDLRSSGEDARQVASLCSEAVERMARGPVSNIDSVGRDGSDGWRVDGVVDGERGDRRFFCAVRDGQIETVDLGDRLASR